jgi:hypothetical protein
MEASYICIRVKWFKKRYINWRTNTSVFAKELRAIMMSDTPVEYVGQPHGCPMTPLNQEVYLENLKREAELTEKYGI